MDASGNRPARLRILDKEVQISCKPGEEDDLMQAAAYIDQSMRDLRRRNTTSSIEKIAIVAAINTANALLKSRSREGVPPDEPTGDHDDSGANPGANPGAIPAAGSGADPGAPSSADPAAPARPEPVAIRALMSDTAGENSALATTGAPAAAQSDIAERLAVLNAKLDELLGTGVANSTVITE